MDLGFTEEQETLRTSARSFVEAETTPALARHPEDAVLAALWRKMVDLGWPAVAIPESDGGAGMGVVELLIVLEEVGRGIAPGPLFATAGQFVPVLLHAAPGALRSEQLAAIPTGRTGTIAVGEDTGAWDPDATTTTARRSGNGWRLTGTKRFVIEGGHADELAVLARTDTGLGLFLVPGRDVAAEAVSSLDPSLRLAHVKLDDVEIEPERVLAPPGAAKAVLERSLGESATAAAALIVGACDAILARTVDYAKTRRQFDQPIGRFQAVKHKLADMYVAVERARSLLYFAGLTVAENDARRGIATSMAKAAAGDCQRLLVQDGLQLHGGIGFTWEYDLHLYLKRAASLDSLLGDSRLHRRRVARHLGLT